MAVAIEAARAVARLAAYAQEQGITSPEDYAWACNRLMECCGCYGPAPEFVALPEGYAHMGEQTEFFFEKGSYELTLILKAAEQS